MIRISIRAMVTWSIESLLKLCDQSKTCRDGRLTVHCYECLITRVKMYIFLELKVRGSTVTFYFQGQFATCPKFIHAHTTQATLRARPNLSPCTALKAETDLLCR